MADKTKMDEKELKDVNGGVIVSTIFFFKCNKCGANWQTNRPDYYTTCVKCGSSDIEEV